MRFPTPTYAGVTATVALFVALGGSSYAALRPAGPAGGTNVVARRDDFTIPPASGTVIGDAECQTGKRAVGGGAGMTGPLDGSAAIYFDEPHEADGSLAEDGDVATSWQAGAANSAAQPRTMNVFVLCAGP